MTHYIALARKYRPKTYADLIGQDTLVKSLSNSIQNNKLHHAYLFTGTRGVGKTTTARIFAKSINCQTGITTTPCLKCDNCLDVDNNTNIDLIEIDAASNTKVEDMRDLLEKVKYMPAKSRFKVYIIDEVHMLSNHSFNALLKTLEEPPSYVKFILATTEKQKIPQTIVSRCLQYYLKSPSDELLASYLKKILDTESISYEAEAISDVVYAANGSVRDALSILEQATSFGSLTKDTTMTLLGLGHNKEVHSIVKNVLQNDAMSALNHFNKLYDAVMLDSSWFLNQMLDFIHQITLAKITKTIPEDIKDLVELSPSLEELQMMYQILVNAKRDLSFVKNDRYMLEMTIIRLIAFSEMSPEIIPDKPISAEISNPREHAPTITDTSKIQASRLDPKNEEKLEPLLSQGIEMKQA